MNIPQQQLDELYTCAEQLRVKALRLPSMIAHASQADAKSRAEEVAGMAARLTVKLEHAGATPRQSMIPPEPTPLHLLDTPTSRRYVEALREAHRIARELDLERGYGDSVHAQAVEELLAPATLEVYGPAGLDG